MLSPQAIRSPKHKHRKLPGTEWALEPKTKAPKGFLLAIENRAEHGGFCGRSELN
jgi:hypothetical protein